MEVLCNMNNQTNNPGQTNRGYSIPIYMDPIRDSCNVDLMVAVYDYYCRQNRSYDLKHYIGAVIKLFKEQAPNFPHTEEVITHIVDAVEMNAFWEGFRGCRDILTDSVSKRIFATLDEVADDDE